MYIRKSVLVTCSIILALVIFVGTIMVVNPFGPAEFMRFMKFNMGIEALREYYYEDVDSEKLVDGALLGASYSLEDPYTVYMNKEDAKSFVESVESDDYTGIGLYISNDVSDNRVTIISPLAGSPAESAGITTGDKILAVDGEAVSGENIDEAASKMKGPEGTKVVLKVLKKSSGETVDIELVRAMIKRETVTSDMLDNNIGYIQISQFGINTESEFIENFNNLIGEGMEKIVIDLRNNPGGYMEMAVGIADCFLDEGEIVYTLNKSGKKRVYDAQKGSTRIPMVILTNGGSASASEILVGAMKDYGLAKIVGEKTFGKGVTQVPLTLYDGSIMKITDSRYYTPKGVCIDKEGIEPDVKVEMSIEDASNLSELSFDEDIQLKTAVRILLENEN